MSRGSRGPAGPSLSTTSYALLSLLGIRSWSTYELARQMDRSLGRIWPRAQSKIYEEPKKLVARGLATARHEQVGARPRTVYSITEEGRRELAAWMKVPGAGPVIESEQLLKVFFAEHGTREDVLASLDAAVAWAAERNEDNLRVGRAYAEGDGAFPERLAQTMLVSRFLTDFYRLVAEWAEWATDIVEQWPEDPGEAQGDPEVLRETVRRASWSSQSSPESRRLR